MVDWGGASRNNVRYAVVCGIMSLFRHDACWDTELRMERIA